MIEIVTLGRETLRHNGSELDGIAGHKQKFALLTYIALEGPVSRERLLAMFWPDREDERARHSLSQALYALRRELDGDYVQVEGDMISARQTRLDVERFESAIETEDWEAVTELYGGPFLDQFVLTGAPDFEAWQTATRTRLARLAKRAFPKVIERRMAEGDLREATAMASRWVSLDPLEDEAQHIFITLLAQSGQRTAAIEQFENYKQRLAKELEVEPLEGTLALVERIRTGLIPEYRPLTEQVAAPASPPAAPASPPAAPEAVGAERPSPPEMPLGQQLWARRIPHVALVYLLVAWFGTRLVGELVFQARLPEWVSSAATLLLVLGLPVAIVLAWANAATTQVEDAGRARLWPRWAERVRGSQVAWFLTGIALLLGVAHAVVTRVPVPLKRNQVVVFPFRVSGAGDQTAGEQMASWIGTAIETNSPIRYIDGWYPVNLGGTDIRSASQRDLRRNTIDLRAGFLLQGGITFGTDSVLVRAEITDVADESLVARATAAGPLTDEWVRREGRKIVGELLPKLREAAGLAAVEDQDVRMPSDTPAAADSFLVAEQLYRRLQFGEALRRYESAIAADSGFAIAALKGAMAAGWVREWGTGARLTEVALRQRPFLEPSRAEFARGLEFYYDGRGDSAVAAFRRVVELAPDWVEARAQLGETHYHLFTSSAPADSLAQAAFASARAANPEFYPALYHLIQIALRNDQVTLATGMMDEFNQLEPDTALTRHAANIMFECVSGSPEVVDWRQHALDHPMAVYEAAQSLAAGGRQIPCARAALRAIVQYDEDNGAARFGALLGLASLLTAEGRGEELSQLAQSEPANARVMSDIIVLASIAGLDIEPRASARVSQILEDIADETKVRSNHYLWIAGAWAATHDQLSDTELLADSLRAQAVGDAGSALDATLARSLDGMLAFARADTAAALQTFEELVPERRARTENPFVWPWESRAWEIVTLARLRYTRGEYRDAIQAAAMLDSPARPLWDLMYLPETLVVRVQAARALGDSALENELRARLRGLARTDLLDSLPQ